MTAKNKGRDRRDPKGKFDQHDTVNGGASFMAALKEATSTDLISPGSV